MKNIIIFLLSFSVCQLLYAQSPVDVLHYQFSLQLNEKSDTISGLAEIKFLVTQNSDQFRFDLTNINEEGKGMTVTAAKLSRGNQLVTGAFIHEKDEVLFKGALQKGDTAAVIIHYKGIPADGLIISKNKYGHRTFFSDNWPNRAHNWIPCVDHPSDKAAVRFTVVAPAHFQVVSNGIQVEETNLPDNTKQTTWQEDVPLPTKVMVIGVADFAVANAGMVNNCIPVSSWVFPENRSQGYYDYAPAKDILSWFIQYIGPYAYSKLANVQSKTIFGGMENASAIFYYENSVTGKRQEEALLAHEIVHQWFGNHATEKSFAHLWLSEGFATYLTHVYIESRYGTDSLNKRMKNERREVLDFVKTTNRPVVDNTPELMQLLNANSYQKGGWVLHMLRRQLGDPVFHNIIRKYYETYAGKNADTRDFQQIAETVSGKKLGTFINQWLYTPENPKLDIIWKYDESKKTVSITVIQLQNQLFELPLQIAIGNKTETLSISRKTETFVLPVSSKPATIIADPNTSLLIDAKVNQSN
ncbi:MAG: M1 family aminopeptidase [Bacteroidetes bacterium]|nr:M1 family aminopeptidase [Bacteroidota bacterium]